MKKQNYRCFHPAIIVASNDAGGANQLINFLKFNHITPKLAVMTGPAEKIWKNEFPNKSSRTTIELESKIDQIITSTGWATNTEFDAIYFGKKNGIETISILDHWVNYSDRFKRNGIEVLPDEIWVVDEYALANAKRCFSGKKIVLHQDWYAESLLNNVSKFPESKIPKILYTLEPVRSFWGRSKLGEFQALDYFLSNLPKLGLPKFTKTLLRPHPSEDLIKYEPFLRSSQEYPVEFAEGSLEKNLSESKFVAGCQTYAMTLGLKANRKVFCTMPPWAPECQLPHDDIIHLKNLF